MYIKECQQSRTKSPYVNGYSWFLREMLTFSNHIHITDFVFIFELVPCKSCHFNNLLTEAGVMHEAGYVDSIWST